MEAEAEAASEGGGLVRIEYSEERLGELSTIVGQVEVADVDSL